MTLDQIDKMIDAGIKAANLYESANVDLITHAKLRRFFAAALMDFHTCQSSDCMELLRKGPSA